MTLEEKIRRRLIDYYLFGEKKIARQLGSLYLRLAKQRISEEEAVAACVEGFYWLKVAGCPLDIDFSEPDIQALKDTLGRTLTLAFKKSPSP